MPRDEHTAVLDDPTASMVVFGGFEDGERVNTVAIYNLKTNVWQRVQYPTKASVPCPRSGHTAVVYQS